MWAGPGVWGRSGGVGRSEGVGRRVVVGWAILTAFFLFMGMDDATKLHERLGSIFSWMVTDDAGDAKGHILGRLYDVLSKLYLATGGWTHLRRVGDSSSSYSFIKGLPSWHT